LSKTVRLFERLARQAGSRASRARKILVRNDVLEGAVVTDDVLSPGGLLTPDRFDVLRAYERYLTRSPEAAEAEAAALLSPHRLSVQRDRASFRALGRFADAGGVTVCHMSYGSEVTIDRAGQERYLAVLVPAAGHIEVLHQGQRHVVSAGRAVAVLTPGEPVHMSWGAGSEVFTLRADTRAMQEALKALAPHADDRPLRFRAPVLDFRSGIAVYGAARLLADVFSQYPSAKEIPRRIIQMLADQALNAVLLGLENNHSEEIRRHAQAYRTASVSAAIELVDAETYATHSVADLARHCGVTVRGLELAFRKALGVSPNAFLQRRRLEKAHSELRAADAADGVTVTQVAARWGFWHTGRFAARYREAYGALPSQTLRLGSVNGNR
jgi:AraC-like DNA-binding protein